MTLALYKQLENISTLQNERIYYHNIRGVVGTGVGFKVRNGKRTNTPALIVYVAPGLKDREIAAIASHQRIPLHGLFVENGSRIEIPTDLVEASPATLQHSLVAGLSTANCSTPEVSGTIGWMATTIDGLRLLCSCYHVLLADDLKRQGRKSTVKYSDSAVRTDAMSPSHPYKGIPERDKIGFVSHGIRSRFVDLAVVNVNDQERPYAQIITGASYSNPRWIKPTQLTPEPETVYVVVSEREPVKTELLEYPVSYPVIYPGYKRSGFTMHNLIATSGVTLDGDSGSLLIDIEYRPLGMLIGIDKTSDRSFFMPMHSILMALENMGYTV